MHAADDERDHAAGDQPVPDHSELTVLGATGLRI
jgi:hypothetical protein